MRITYVKFSNYRAFLNENDEERNDYELNIPDGNNLLIYGENGSGKSSLFKGFKDFFSSAFDANLQFTNNLNYKAQNISDKPHIAIKFDNTPDEYFFSYDPALTNTNTAEFIKKANLSKGFISYKELLKLHFTIDDNEINYFDFFMGERGLFSDLIVETPKISANKIKFRELLLKAFTTHDQEAMLDYNINAQALFSDLENKANRLLSYFNEGIELKIVYINGTASAAENTSPSLEINVYLFNKLIPSHHHFLNEARLTSIAISIYLSHILSFSRTEIQVLFLDDIFLGLDMSNRLPLLDILTATDLGNGKTFKDYQIFLTTYDREWYEISKSWLDEKWLAIELFVNNSSQDFERPFLRKNNTYIERARESLFSGDYPASANYLRKEFEKILKSILPDNMIYSQFDESDGNHSVVGISKAHFNLAQDEQNWFFKFKKDSSETVHINRYLGLGTLIGKFEQLIKKYNIPFSAHVEKLQSLKNRLLNPLSHDNLKSLVFKKELLLALDLIEELKLIKSHVVINSDEENPVLLYVKKKDYRGIEFRYCFALLDNLRFFQYKNFRVLLNTPCRSLYRIQECGQIELFPKDYKSIREVCNGVYKLSTGPNANKGFLDANFEFDSILNENHKNIATLIDEI